MAARRGGTVDWAEIAKFDSLAAQWWDPSGPASMLHRMNPARIRFVQDLVRSQGRNMYDERILDVGCGGGIATESLARLGAKSVGIDLANEAVHVARTRAARDWTVRDRIEYVQGSIEDQSFKDTYGTPTTKFSTVVAFEVIEHVPDIPRFLGHLLDVLSPQRGLLILSTMNRTPASYLANILAAEYLLRLVPPGTHNWNQFRSPEEVIQILQTLAKSTNRRYTALHNAGLNPGPTLRSFSITSSLSTNYIHAGLLSDDLIETNTNTCSS